MTLVDANLLLYARDQESPFHDKARGWLEDALRGSARVGIPWQSILAFLRVSTSPRSARVPLDPTAARGQVDAWMRAPATWIPQPAADHWRILDSLVEKYELRGNLIPDAHLAALAIEHGLELYSADTDFARFDELRWVNPLR